MVPVAKVANGFHARVLVARLGSEGILTQLRGGVDGPYPMGAVEVLVEAPDADLARELLLADEVESAFEEELAGGGLVDRSDRRRAAAPWVMVLVVVALAVFAYVNTVGFQRRPPEDGPAPSGQEPGESRLVQPPEGPTVGGSR